MAVSLRAYSRYRGVSLAAVQAAIASGRLTSSVTTDDRGARKLTSFDDADAEWAANTRPPSDVPPPRPPGPAPQRIAANRPSTEVPLDADNPADYAEAKFWREAELWRIAKIKRQADELDLAAKRAAVVPVEQARADVIDRFTAVKTKLLGVATRMRQRLPDVDPAAVRVADELIREALEELAAGE